MECDDPRQSHRNKFGVVLNKNTAEDETLLAITTSKLDRYPSSIFDADILRIPAGIYTFFDRDTIINLREVRIEAVAAMKQLCHQQQMSFEGVLTTADMAMIDQKVRASKLITVRLKKRII